METETSFHGFDNVVQLPLPTNSFSAIFTARHVETNRQVCLKRFRKNYMNEALIIQVRNEIDLLSRIRNPYIVQYIGYIENETHITIVIEQIQGKTLLQFVDDSGGLIEYEAQNIFIHICIAIYFLHSTCKIAHRDLKLENIMIPDNSDDIPKIIDFGVSKEFYEETANSSDFKPLMSTLCGSFPYCAPEIIKGGPYTKSIDIWSAGIILYTILTSELPFQDENEMQLAMKILHEEPIYPSHLTQNSLDLLQKMLNKDPTQRITIEHILRHPWINSSEFDTKANLGLIKNPAVSSFCSTSQVNQPHDALVIQHIRMKHPSIDITKLENDLNANVSSNETMTYNILKIGQYHRNFEELKKKVSQINLPPFTLSCVPNIPAVKLSSRPTYRQPAISLFLKPVSSDSMLDKGNGQATVSGRGVGIRRQLISYINVNSTISDQDNDPIVDESPSNSAKLPPLLTPDAKPIGEFSPQHVKKTRKLSAHVLLTNILAKNKKT